MLKSEDALQLQQVSCCFVVKLLLRFCLEWGRQFENKNLTVYLHMHVYTKQFGKIENTELNIPYMFICKEMRINAIIIVYFILNLFHSVVVNGYKYITSVCWKLFEIEKYLKLDLM